MAFGPCKHGKYNETKYQDTFIFDIIDYEDAKRHTIQTGDRVLATWEPEGERFCPGVVIEGQEKRQVDGKQLYVGPCSLKILLILLVALSLPSLPLSHSITRPYISLSLCLSLSLFLSMSVCLSFYLSFLLSLSCSQSLALSCSFISLSLNLSLSLK